MPGMLVDISVGGMKILLERLPAGVSLQPGTAVAGHIESENPAFRMDFTATVAWQRPADATAVALGLRFADYTPLPDPLMHLLENYEAV